MSLTNFNIIQLVNIAVNRDINTQAFSTAEYQTMINSNSIRKFKIKLGLPEEYSKDYPVAQEGVGLTKKIEQDLEPFLHYDVLPVAGGVLDLSSKDIGYLIDLVPSPVGTRGMDYITLSEVGDRLNNPITEPTADDPVYYRTAKDTFSVAPVSIVNVSTAYYKNPVEAVVIITADPTTLLPVYDANASTELEWDDINKIDIAYMIIRDAGVNIERADVVQYANNLVKTSK
jgi:hypothetical protein